MANASTTSDLRWAECSPADLLVDLKAHGIPRAQTPPLVELIFDEVEAEAEALRLAAEMKKADIQFSFSGGDNWTIHMPITKGMDEPYLVKALAVDLRGRYPHLSAAILYR